MSVTTHMCRGNFRSAWAAEGGYDFVAEALLNELEVDGFFMEWDDERSGGFEPLRFLPKGEKQVVLGLVTTKRGELESKDELKRRIEEASKYAPLEQLCLSPQCGFSSTVEGNVLTRGRAVGEAAPDRRGRAGSLGLTGPHGSRRDVRRLPPARADDAVLEPGLDRGAVPRRAAGRPALRARAARGRRSSRSRPATRSGAASRRSRSAHDGRARQRRRRARDRAREPRAARRPRRPAGPAAPRLRAVPRRAARGARGRLPGLGRPAGAARRTCPARSSARTTRQRRTAGPALVIVPMDDWARAGRRGARGRGRRGGSCARAGVDPARGRRAGRVPRRRATRRRSSSARAPTTRRRGRRSSRSRERLVAPVFQESFGARAGFPQDHPLFAGFLPADRPRLREKLAPYDALLVVGAPVFRQSPYAPGRFTEPARGSRVVSDDADEVHRSPAELAVLAPPAAVCRELAERVPAARRRAAASRSARRRRPSRGEPLRAGHVLAALAERLPREAVVVEEAPVDRPELHDRLLAARAARLPQRRDGRARLRARRRDRRAHGAARPPRRRGRRRRLVDLRHPGAVERRALPRRRPLRDPLERRLRDHGPPRRAHGDARAPWPAFDEVDVAALARASAARRAGSRRTTSSSRARRGRADARVARASRCCSTSSIAPTATFAP